MDHVVYTTVYLTDISQYGEMNGVLRRVLWEDSAGSRCARRCRAS